MCGIAGLIDPEGPVDDGVLSAMAKSLMPRGPDDEGRVLQSGLALVHRRLSIIDLSTGRQPILNEAGNLALVCNGEIYNFRELRRELEGRGHTFRTASDSEVILHLYEEEGTDSVARLNGMFAFVITDLNENTLFLARDRFGQKPLFYSLCGKKVAFASGPSALATLDWVDTSLNHEAVHHYLEYQAIPAPLSIYTGVSKLEPGTHALWKGRELLTTRYWRPQLTPAFDGNYDNAVERVRESIGGAVERRLVSDVPLGGFLSGGMDSSIIAALGARASDQPFSTFSIGFPEKKYDEREYAQEVASHLGTDHHFLEVVPDDFSQLAQVVSACEEPFCDASILPTSLLSRFTRDHVTVALSGDGADELFGGYYRYRVMHYLQLLTTVPASLRAVVKRALLSILPPKVEERTFWGRIRRLVELSDLSGLNQYLALISRFSDSLRRSLYSDEMRDRVAGVDSLSPLAKGFRDGGGLVNGIMELDCATYLPNDILVKVDRASMACGLEVRSPFLDPDVAELALSLPDSFKMRGRVRKRILQDAFPDLLPASIFTRPKMGFGMPVARWLRDGWREPARELILDGAVLPQFFRRDGLERLLTEHVENRADHSYALFALLVLEMSLNSDRFNSGKNVGFM
ncbi:MAG: asparagine synthase (glutamine-hydrolyzing) [Planctomycetota bacterium]|jgi:asparagine synthase (glutamine-hydrolysing)